MFPCRAVTTENTNPWSQIRPNVPSSQLRVAERRFFYSPPLSTFHSEQISRFKMHEITASFKSNDKAHSY